MSRRLKFAREKAGYKTASDAARALGMRESTYLAHENGSRGFSSGSARRYARFFHVTLEWLLTGRGDREMNDLLKAYNALPESKKQQALNFIKYLLDEEKKQKH